MNSPRGFTAELCVALAHRWEPERLFLLIYTAYLDESGTHGGSAVTVMGGILANARQWEAFETDFARVKKKHGFRIFHTKKFKAKRGDFAGWTNRQCLALVKDLAAISDRAFTEGVSMSLENDTYENDYKKGEKPNRLRLDSKYGLCFRQCLIFLMLEMQKRQHRKKLPKLHIVLESGDPNIGDAIRIFNEMKKEFGAAGHDMLATITQADKDDCDPLMMADFVAHSIYTTERRTLAGGPRRLAQSVARKQSMITNLRFKPGGLADIKEELIANMGRRMG